MNDLIQWLHDHPWTVYSTLISLILYFYKTLPKGKWIRKKDTAATSLGDSVETMETLNSSSKEVESESDRNVASFQFHSSNLSKAVNSQSDSR